MSTAVAARVLVVDDERIIADSLVLILRTRGYAARAAYNSEQAIAIAVEFHPHAVISDVIMPPGMDGIALARYLVEADPACKVLLMSGNADTVRLLELADSQDTLPTVLAKPVHPAQILEFVSGCLPACAKRPEA